MRLPGRVLEISRQLAAACTAGELIELRRLLLADVHQGERFVSLDRLTWACVALELVRHAEGTGGGLVRQGTGGGSAGGA